MTKLSMRLTEAISLGLGLDKDRFVDLFDDHTSYLRLNYYPICPDGDGTTLGVNRHTDAGFLTILKQSNVASLQGRCY